MNSPTPEELGAANTPASPSLWPSLPGAPTRRIIHIAVLLIATLIAGWPIASLIDERETRQAAVLAEFTRSWGPQQQVRGPVLVVPYQTAFDQPRRYLKIAPTSLKAAVQLSPEEHRRGLFHATVYTAAMEMQGAFAVPAEAKLAELVGVTGKVYWTDAVVMLEAPSLAGMTAKDGFAWGDEARPWRNCREVLSREVDCEGASAVLAQPKLAEVPKPETPLPFRAAVTLRGSGSYTLLAQGKQVEATMAAPWPTPSFSGTLLPSSYNVTATDFDALWQSVEQTAPQMWSSARVVESGAWKGTSLGVELLEATPTYRMIHRASKYNILFVTLAFTTYFLFELLSGLRIHIVQYGLLGVSLSLFALLLLSLSEPLGYSAGYGLSAGLILVQSSLYTAAVARRLLPAAIFAAMLTGLFGFLYVVLSLETYSLLVGSLALFVVVSVVMALTQRVDWAAGGTVPGKGR